MIRRILLSLVLVAVSTVHSVTPVAAQTWLGTQEGWWVNCASGHRTTDCIETVELQLSGSTTWTTATAAANASFTYGSREDDAGIDTNGNCGTGRGALYDVCYVFPGMGAAGADLKLRIQSTHGTENLSFFATVVAGGTPVAQRSDGYVFSALPQGAQIRLTLRSTALAQQIGWISSSLKTPALSLPGGEKVVISGEPMVMWSMKQGENRPDICERSDTTAGTVIDGFMISINPYKYTTEKMAGTAAGGVMVGVNALCGSSEAFYDASQGTLAIRIGGPHFDFDGKEITGWMEASIRGDVVRKGFQKDPSKLDQVRVSVFYGSGEQQIASVTTRYVASSDAVEIRAYGFQYSSPKIVMNFGKPATAAKPTKKTTITCAKGKTIRKVTGTKPACPAGFKKKA